ncbi:MAG: single-stranded DNA-binding protein [Syntrophomonadaceae bacterium]|nr:single-stranded DNA-binding protein [Syntrophomonadaceae bacterium]
MLNRVILIGRLTRDPEMRYTPNGIAVSRFTLAVNRPFTNQMGERDADFIDIVTWRQLAETCANYLGKGRLVAVEGRLQARTYEAQDGQKRKVVEVVADTVKFLDKGGQQGKPAPSEGRRSIEDDGWESLGQEVNLDNIDVVGDDDEIPF